MSDSVVDKARQLQQIAGEVKAAKAAVQHARRLQSRAGDLRTALEAPARAAKTWLACRDVGVSGLTTPDHAGLVHALAELRHGLSTAEPPPDSAFDSVKHGLQAVAHRTDGAIAEAWTAFAQSKSAPGLAAVRVLPPASQRSLKVTVAAVEQALTSAPANDAQVSMFMRNVAALEREVSATHLNDLPTPLAPVLERLSIGGFPLAELTEEQLRLLREHGLVNDLEVRWTP